MLSNKERVIWILGILIAVVSTFFVTSNLYANSQDINVEVSSTKVFTDIEKEANQ